MHKWMTMILLLAGCDHLADQQSEGVALATLRGTLVLGQNVAPPVSNLRVSVLWQDPTIRGDLHEPGVITFPLGQAMPDAPSPCAAGQPTGWRFETGLLEQPGRLSTAFPSGFTVRLSEPPPAAALFDYPDGSGVASATGDLVVYEDRNGNDKLDPSTFDTVSPDLIYGTSVGPAPWGVGQRKQYSIVYLTRDTPLHDGDGQAGYSLLTGEYDALGSVQSSAQRLSDATIELTLDPTPYAQQLACSVMCKADDLDLIDDPQAFLAGDVGVQLPSNVGPGTSVWSKQVGDATMLTLARCTKQPTPDSGEARALELSVVKTQGCTETASRYIVVSGAAVGDPPEPPCTEYVDASNLFPTDP